MYLKLFHFTTCPDCSGNCIYKQFDTSFFKIKFMKKNFFLLFFVLTSNYLKAQFDSAVVIAIDAKGRSDTVFFGSHPTATIGVDLALGEVNIYGQQYDSLDLRIIQRSVMCDDLGMNTLIYPTDLDMKKDIRAGIGSGPIPSSNFSFKIVSDTFPVYIRLMKYNIDLFAQVFIYDSSCNRFQDTSICPVNQCTIPDTLLIINANSEFRIYPEVITSVKSNSQNHFKISPNPATNKLVIQSSESDILDIQLYNSMGNYLLSSKKNEIDVENLVQGLYFLQIQVGDKIYTSKFIKN